MQLSHVSFFESLHYLRYNYTKERGTNIKIVSKEKNTKMQSAVINYFSLHIYLTYVLRSLSARFIILIALQSYNLSRVFPLPLSFSFSLYDEQRRQSTFVPNKVRALVTKKRLFYTRLVPDDGARTNVCNIIILARHIAPGLDEIIDVEYRYPFSCVPYGPSYRATIMYYTKTFRYLSVKYISFSNTFALTSLYRCYSTTSS